MSEHSIIEYLKELPKIEPPVFAMMHGETLREFMDVLVEDEFLISPSLDRYQQPTGVYEVRSRNLEAPGVICYISAISSIPEGKIFTVPHGKTTREFEFCTPPDSAL